MQNGTLTSPHFCDLVMKGGITSGVIYPSAAARLAEIYTFRNIGGTSAGAIAAAVTAAAEYGRQKENPESFQQLAEFPAWIGAAGRLLGMFAPSRPTRGLFQLIVLPLTAKSVIGRLAALARIIIMHFYWALVAAAVVFAAIAYGGGGDAWGWASAALAGVLVFALGLVWLLWRRFSRAVPRNFYGLSKAFDPKSESTEGPLINWLAPYLNRLAGKPSDGLPLTFGDLHSAGINLEVMTTAVNLGRPYRLPFRDPDRIFYFCPDEFRTLFPSGVVEHMIARAPARKGKTPRTADGKLLIAFPDEEDLPVVVATRMSLSFPILLAAVPLYTVDFTRKANQHLAEDEQPLAERCWFSDGGETSNLPIHFFDAPIPEWPTFAINLKDFHPDYQNEEDAVWLPMRNDSGWRSQWTRFEQPGQFGSPLAFLGTIVSTFYNWQDNALSLVPGYRDRIVSVSLRPDEGGYNLNMDAATVNRLSDRGRRAGEALIQRFYEGEGWANHVWLRFRSCVQLTAHWLCGLGRAGEPPIGSAIRSWMDGGSPSYSVPAHLREQFQRTAGVLLDPAREIDNGMMRALDTDAPRPQPELRIRPRV
jgi:predicted acylesterase/phospholipase RssA